jgi:hypothetical protein
MRKYNDPLAGDYPRRATAHVRIHLHLQLLTDLNEGQNVLTNVNEYPSHQRFSSCYRGAPGLFRDTCKTQNQHRLTSIISVLFPNAERFTVCGRVTGPLSAALRHVNPSKFQFYCNAYLSDRHSCLSTLARITNAHPSPRMRSNGVRSEVFTAASTPMMEAAHNCGTSVKFHQTARHKTSENSSDKKMCSYQTSQV